MLVCTFRALEHSNASRAFQQVCKTKKAAPEAMHEGEALEEGAVGLLVLLQAAMAVVAITMWVVLAMTVRACQRQHVHSLSVTMILHEPPPSLRRSSVHHHRCSVNEETTPSKGRTSMSGLQ